jgi:hypothetical protein
VSWCKVDDQFADHPKFVGLSNDAVAMWVRGLAYCNRHMTDGRIPADAAPALAKHKKPHAIARELIAARLWNETPGAYLVHDFLALNEARVDRERKLAEAKARKERWRNKSTGRFGDANGTPEERVPERVTDASPLRHGDAFRTHVERPPGEREGNVHQKPKPKPKPKSEIPDLPNGASEPPKAKPAKPAAQPHPRHADVVAAYFESFERARGSKPIFGARDGASVKALLEKCAGSADRAIEVIRSAFAGDPFKAKNATIASIAADPSKYLGTPSVPARAPWAPKVQPGVTDASGAYVPTGKAPPPRDPNAEELPYGSDDDIPI